MHNIENETFYATLDECRKAPSIVSDIVAARDAWRRYQHYDALAKRAYDRFHKHAPGTTSAQRYWGRYSAYKHIAEGWAQVLGAYLEDSAQIAIDDAKGK